MLSKIVNIYRHEGLRGIKTRTGRRLYWLTRPVIEEIIWQVGYAIHPFRQTGHPPRHRPWTPASAYEGVLRDLEVACVAVEHVRVDAAAYHEYMAMANYPAIYGPWLAEKSLEHFLSLQYLEIQSDDVVVDIASCNSPFPDIVRSLYGCTVYRQDLTYEPGIHGDQIGGNAALLPLADGFASKMTLHCSFEHFEGDSDTGFVQEAARVLRPGGRLCILPLYVNDEYCILTDPFADRTGMSVEAGARLRFVRRWLGGRHGRFYDVAHLQSRVLRYCSPFKTRLLFVENPEAVSVDCYVRFILLLEKR